MLNSNWSNKLCLYKPVRLSISVWPIMIFMLVATWIGGCQTPTKEAVPLGIQPSYEAFVPARTAVLPCVAWPNTVRPKDLPLNSVDAATLAQLCKEVDAAVLDAFTNQPFMKGFSPKYVTDRLAAANVTYDQETLAQLWDWTGESCQDCSSIEAIYSEKISVQTDWQAWLSQTSAQLNYADAVLLPFITYAFHRRYESRGTMVQERNMEVTIMLIATKNGELIWLGKRQSSIPVYAMNAAALPEDVPPWADVLDLVLTESLWMKYPGRQVY